MIRHVLQALAVACLMDASSASAQDQAPGRWTWTGDATVFFGVNQQDRKFRDFTAWESQNWFMGTGTREAGRGRVLVTGMLSLEPLTLKRLGSPQVFQTGESYQNAPLIDYQHPHDLFMQAGFEYARPIRGATARLGAALVGSPSLGPPAFMHRASAAYNPQVPLSHHQMDATHITPGVITAAIGARGLEIEASVFHGREPDENRYDVDLGALDSWAARATWTRGSISAQVSGGRLNSPERLEPYFDHTRLSASIAYARGGTSAILAWGENREIHGAMDAYLVETLHRWRAANVIYTRAELGSRDILDRGGLHPPNFIHPHRLSRVAAVTGGFARDLIVSRRGTVSAGADVTGYHVAENLKDSYGSPLSYHLFVRFGLQAAPASHHHP